MRGGRGEEGERKGSMGEVEGILSIMCTWVMNVKVLCV